MKKLCYPSIFRNSITIIIYLVSFLINIKKINYPHAGTVNIATGNSNLELFKHQNDAIKILNDKILSTGKNPFAGLLVLPTGGGKTLTATYWLLKNYTDKNKKISMDSPST